MLFGISTCHVKGKIKLLAQIDLPCDHLYFTTPGKVATNLQTPKLSLFTFKVVCRTSFQISSGKLQKFTYNGVDNWCNFQLTNWRNVSFIGKEWYIYLFICLFIYFSLQVRTMKYAESKNIWNIIVSVNIRIKLNIKDT